MMSNTRLLIVFCAACAACALIFLPAQLMLGTVPERIGLHYSRAEGGLWGMTLHDASLGAKPLGRVTVTPDIFAALTGNFSAQLNFEQADFQKAGGNGNIRFAYGDDALRLSDMTLHYPIQAQSPIGPVSGALDVLEGGFALTPQGACVSGEAALRTDVLDAVFTRLGFQPVLLSGTAACDGAGAFTLALAGSVDGAGITVTGALAPAHIKEQRLPLEVQIDLPEDVGAERLISQLKSAGLEPVDGGLKGRLFVSLR